MEPKAKRKIKPKALIYISGFIVFLALIILVISVNYNNESLVTVLSYKSDISQSNKVYNNDQTFYKPDYLENQEVYVSSITSVIDFLINYDIEFSRSNKIDYTIEVTGKIIAADLANKDTFLWEEPITFNDKVHEKTAEQDKLAITNEFTFNFAEARQKLNAYQNTYGIVINGYAVINVKVTINNLYDNLGESVLASNNPTNTKELVITIPLMNKTFSINVTKPESNTQNLNVIYYRDDTLNQYLHLIGIGLFFVGFGLFIYGLIYKKRNTTTRDLYKARVKELISKYEEIIVRVEAIPNDSVQTIKILEFNDLVDMEQETKIPILVKEFKHETIFVIIKKEYKYIYTIKESDFE